MSSLSAAPSHWPAGLLWLPAPQPHSPRSPRRLEKELETLENGSSAGSTKENLAEAAAPAKEQKAEPVPNAQKVGTAALWAGLPAREGNEGRCSLPLSHTRAGSRCWCRAGCCQVLVWLRWPWTPVG